LKASQTPKRLSRRVAVRLRCERRRRRARVEANHLHRGAVQALAPGESQVTPRLAALVRKQLVRPDKTQLPGEDAFRFRHLLLRDAAYEALPKAVRAELHQRFASWLEEHGTELAWHFPRGVPECPSPLVANGRVYMVMNGGTVTCLDAKSGALVFQDRLAARGPYYASLVGGDKKLIAASARGEVTLFAAEDTLRVLSTVDLGERLMATPALSDGVVYVRTETKLRAFGAAMPAASPR